MSGCGAVARAGGAERAASISSASVISAAAAHRADPALNDFALRKTGIGPPEPYCLKPMVMRAELAVKITGLL